MDKQKITDLSKRFYSSHKLLCITALVYFAVILLSAVYTPWTENSHSQEFADTITMLKHSSNIWLKLIFNIFYVGMADIMEMLVYAEYADQDGMFTLIFVCLLSVQKIIAEKLSRNFYFKNKPEEIAVGYMIGNILFAVSAYLNYFLYKKLLNLETFSSLDNTPFFILAAVVLLMIVLFMIPGLTYMSIHLAVFSKLGQNIVAINDYFEQLFGGNDLLAAPVILLLVLLLSFLTEWLADKVHDTFLEATGELVTKFLPFLAPVYEFLSD